MDQKLSARVEELLTPIGAPVSVHFFVCIKNCSFYCEAGCDFV